MEWTDPRYANVVAWYREAAARQAETPTDPKSDEEAEMVRAFLVTHTND
ncbi:hypothetical protein [Kitasatospora mediocidica]|nr:hypothetical protein [Kitasatospora mediocidica]